MNKMSQAFLWIFLNIVLGSNVSFARVSISDIGKVCQKELSKISKLQKRGCELSDYPKMNRTKIQTTCECISDQLREHVSVKPSFNLKLIYKSERRKLKKSRTCMSYKFLMTMEEAPAHLDYDIYVGIYAQCLYAD